jgi:N-acetyl-gamma-glutamyl-phosphate reductase
VLRVAVAGASGYMGAEALRLLCVHPKLKLVAVTSERLAGQRLDKVFPHLRGLSTLVFSELDPQRISDEATSFSCATAH